MSAPLVWNHMRENREERIWPYLTQSVYSSMYEKCHIWSIARTAGQPTYILKLSGVSLENSCICLWSLYQSLDRPKPREFPQTSGATDTVGKIENIAILSQKRFWNILAVTQRFYFVDLYIAYTGADVATLDWSLKLQEPCVNLII